VAIVGAGPAGFFTAEALLKEPDLVCAIDLFDRLPTPFGLVRDGVAPDHPSIKKVTAKFERIAANPSVRFFGNVTFGRDLEREDLRRRYDQIVYAVGAPADRRLGIPGEDLSGSWPATSFVAWYNGHPDFADLEFDLSPDRALVVGNGNVAVDVARILVRSPEELARTDMADHAVAALRESRVREVVMIGRRGPAQAKFTSAELKELGRLEGVDVVVDPADLDLDPDSAAALSASRGALRNYEILTELAARPTTGADRTLVLRFLTSPVELLGDVSVSSVRLERNRLVSGRDGYQRAQGTGELETVDAGLVLRSVGYRGSPLPDVPFDERRAVIPNEAGRVTRGPGGEPVAGEYATGWIKRGPTGIIGTNKPDAVETVRSMLEDLRELPPLEEGIPAVEELLSARGVPYVSRDEWQILDEAERRRGEEEERPRVKFVRVDEMLRVIENRGSGQGG
jgi:ferredoxin--NADP+ reductase